MTAWTNSCCFEKWTNTLPASSTRSSRSVPHARKIQTTCTHAHTRSQDHARMHARMHIRTHATCTHVVTQSRAQSSIPARMHPRAHTCPCAHARARTRTHARTHAVDSVPQEEREASRGIRRKMRMHCSIRFSKECLRTPTNPGLWRLIERV